ASASFAVSVSELSEAILEGFTLTYSLLEAVSSSSSSNMSSKSSSKSSSQVSSKLSEDFLSMISLTIYAILPIATATVTVLATNLKNLLIFINTHLPVQFNTNITHYIVFY